MRGLLVLIVLALVLTGAGWLWSGGNFAFFTDRTAPQLALTRSGGDARRMAFALTGTDAGVGIATLRTTITQTAATPAGAPPAEGKEIEISKETFTPAVASIERTIEIDPKGLGLAEGRAIITTELIDASVSRSAAQASAEFLLDYSPPSVAVISRQFTANQGGAEFLLYRIGGGAYVRTGAQIGDLFFRGFPGSAFDERLAAYPDVHGVLIGLPLGFDAARDRIKVIVEDAGGNSAQTGVEIPIAATKQVDVNSKLSLSFLERKLPELLASYEARANERLDSSDTSTAAQIARFRLINETYRRLLQKEMFALIDKSTQRKLWSGVFSRPIPGKTTSLFGERRSYGLDGAAAGGSLHEGLDLASVHADAVRAVNSGTVAFVGEFGIYGETVMIDHGTGLFSLYGHLSSIATQSGAAVAKDQEIGRTGTTGLAGGDHLHFEFRVGHVSVNPIEWWDAKWITDNIDGKVTELLSLYAERR